MTERKPPRPPQTLSPGDLAEQLGSSTDTGLTTRRAKARRKRFGKNALRGEIEIRFSQSFKNHCRGLTNLFLLVSMLVLYLFEQDSIYLIAAGGALLLILLGAAAESGAAGALNVPAKYTSLSVRVVRDGKLQTLDSRSLVPGDLLLLQKGSMIPADARIVEDDGNLTALETPVSGARSSVRKAARSFGKEDEVVSSNMLYAGTILTGGACTAMVCRTGKQTLLRQIHARREDYLPPLLRSVREFARQTSVICLAACIALVPIGVLRGADVSTVFALAVIIGACSLCDSALSLSLIAFGNGLRKMAGDKLVVKNMDRIAKLATVNTVMCPKELTFPSKRARLLAVFAGGNRYDAADPPRPAARELLKLSLVCSDHPRVYFPFEQVAYTYLKDACVPLQDITDTWFRIERTTNTKGETDAILALHNDHNTVVIKGAPEQVLSRCAGFEENGREYKLTDSARRKLLTEIEAASKENAYLVGIASGITDADSLRAFDVEKRLIFRGFLAFRVSVEVDIANAVYRCNRAGIEAVVATNDPYYTAANLGKSAGLITHEGQMISSREIKAQERGMYLLNVGNYKLFLEPEDEQWQDVLLLRREAGRTVLAASIREEELPLLREADVSAVPANSPDALRESADLLMLESGFHVLANGITNARAICFRIRWVLQYLTGGVCTLFFALLLALLTGTAAPFRVQELLFGGIFANLAIAFTLAMLPTDRKLLQEPLPRFRGKLTLHDLLLPLGYALGGGCAVWGTALLSGHPLCGILCFLLLQFLYACGCLWQDGAFRRRQFGYRALWALLPGLALYGLLLVAMPGLHTVLGFSISQGQGTWPFWQGALLAFGFAAGWQLLIQLLLFFRTTRKKEMQIKGESHS